MIAFSFPVYSISPTSFLIGLYNAYIALFRLRREIFSPLSRWGLPISLRKEIGAKKRACSVLVRCPNDRDWRRWDDDRQGNILRRILILIVFHEYEVIAFSL